MIDKERIYITNKRNVKNEIYLFFLFLLSPAFAFIFSIKHYNINKLNKYIYLFSLFYAITYIAIPDSDATIYEYRINSMKEYTLSSYIYEISNMYNSDAEYNDAYIHTVFLVLSPITKNIIFYRLFFAAIYFSVFLALLKEIQTYKNLNNHKYNWFILGVIFLISFSSGFNGIRWPLALMVFLLGYLRFIKTNNKRYLLFAVSSFLIHFIAGYLVFFLLIYSVSKKYYKPIIAFLLLIVFFVFSFVFTNSVKEASTFLGDGIESKTISYTENDEYKEDRELHLQQVNWYVTFKRFSTNYFVLFALLCCIYFIKQEKKSALVINLEYFAVLMFIASFVSGQLLDTISNRFYLSANAAGLIYLYHLYEEKNSSKLLSNLRLLYIPIVLFHILISLRVDFYTVSPNLIFGNVFTEMFYSFDKSIQEYLLD